MIFSPTFVVQIHNLISDRADLPTVVFIMDYY